MVSVLGSVETPGLSPVVGAWEGALASFGSGPGLPPVGGVDPSALTGFLIGLLARRPTGFSVAQAAAPLTRIKVPPARTQSLRRAADASPSGPG